MRGEERRQNNHNYRFRLCGDLSISVQFNMRSSILTESLDTDYSNETGLKRVGCNGYSRESRNTHIWYVKMGESRGIAKDSCLG